MAGSGGWRAKRIRRQVREVASEARDFERRGVDAAPARCADALLHDYDELRAVTVVEHLRAIAQWTDEAAARIAAQAQQIEAKHGHVFRTAHLITGEHYQPYMDLQAAPERIQRARRLRDRALALARKQDRRVRRGADLSHVETLHTGKDTEGLIKALRDPKPKVRIQAATPLGGNSGIPPPSNR